MRIFVPRPFDTVLNIPIIIPRIVVNGVSGLCRILLLSRASG